jgi:site-specific DNA-methyltransferase (adenine-specific)
VELPTEAEPVKVVCGDAIESLGGLPAEFVQCCVTSPPYYGLRDYGVSGQIGLEPTPDEYVARLVAVFREVRRVLRPDGTLWLNLGDSYAGSANSGGRNRNDGGPPVRVAGLPALAGKPKDLLGIPWMVAFALRADGWYLRQDIIWAKPNPMPESARDRCTKAHEYVFLLSKSPRYHYDAEAVRRPLSQVGREQLRKFQQSGVREGVRAKACIPGQTVHKGGVSGVGRGSRGAAMNPNGANLRSVWTITPKPYRGAHFAVMPPELVRRCVLAGCPVGGVVLDPFLGSGTVAAVALENGRRSTTATAGHW